MPPSGGIVQHSLPHPCPIFKPSPLQFFLYILLLLTPSLLFSQPPKLLKKAYNASNQQTALRYYKKSYKKEPEFRSSSLDQIARIEYKRGNKEKAEELYRSMLITYKDENGSLLYYTNLALADIYTDRKDYNGALNYLRASEQYENNFGCGMGRYSINYERDYKYAICFDALNQWDSAFNKLCRYMFKDIYPVIDRARNLKRGTFFYRLLLKKYSACELKDELFNAISKLNYSCRYDSSWSPDVKMKRITASINFFGFTVVINDFGYGGSQEDIDLYYSKEVFVDAVKRSVLYWLIMGGGEL
jgi:tetratricopeptide (TPR) repeat protein